MEPDHACSAFFAPCSSTASLDARTERTKSTPKASALILPACTGTGLQCGGPEAHHVMLQLHLAGLLEQADASRKPQVNNSLSLFAKHPRTLPG